MKTLRTFMLLLGTLCGAAGLFGQAPLIDNTDPYKIPAAGAIHSDYRLAATMQLRLTMKGVENIVEWATYTDYDKPSSKPKHRTSAWLVGTINNPSGKKLTLSAMDIGLHHRTHIILARMVPEDPAATATLKQTRKNGADVRPPAACDKVLVKDAQGKLVEFLVLYAAGKWDPNGKAFENEYELTTTDTALRLEVMYVDHLPGVFFAQEEDGGPPSIPPVNEN